jgi:hypothetical protein
MRHLTILAALVAVNVTAGAQVGDADRQQLLAARDTVWRAWFANDTAALRRLIPPAAATYEGASGRAVWNDRSKIMSDARQFAGTNRKLAQLAFTNTTISRWAGTAIVRSSYEYVIEGGGKRDTSRGRATELFVHDGKRWVNPYWQLESGAGVAREIPLPDTLGANFSIADSASQSGTLTDYDALLGFWEFHFQNRRPDGTFTPAFSGHWTFEKKPGGALIEDRWRGDNASAPMGLSTYTYRTFHPGRKVWQMLGTNSGGGEFALGATWSDGTNRYAIQHYGSAIMRIKYLAIEPNYFLWRADRSTDGGKTWLLDAWTMEAWRVGK